MRAIIFSRAIRYFRRDSRLTYRDFSRWKMNARAFTRQLRKAQGQVRGIEPRLAREYLRVLRQQAKDAAQAYTDALDVTLAAADPARQVDVEAILRESKIVGEAVQRTQADREKIANVTLAALTTDPAILDSTYERIQALLLTQAGKQAERLVAGSRDVVAEVIQEALETGATVPETASLIRSQLEQIAPYRATMLARTDLIGISNGTSQVAALSIEDAPGYKQWLSAGDERVRETHQEAEGQVVPNDQPFDVGGASLFYPGDPDGPDEEVIQCRCTLIYADGAEGSDVQHSDLLAAAGGDMPYTVEERDGSWCVVNTATGEDVDCHPTEDMAREHEAALFLNVEEAQTAAAVDYSSGSMIALYPRREEAFSLAVEGGQAPEDLHCTLVGFSQPPNVNVVAPLLARLAQELPILTGQVGGTALFDAGADGIPLVALADVLDLNELRAAITMSLDALGQNYNESHGFVPHITLAYVGDPSADLPDSLSGIPLTFENICLCVGNEKLSFPFEGIGTDLVPLTEMDIAEQEGIEPFSEDVYEEGVGAMGTNLRAAMIEGSAALVAADISTSQREALAKSGEAMPDGGYPIRNGADLGRAILAFGRASDPAATKAHIQKRAKELGLTDKLPADWSASTKEESMTAAAAGMAPVAPPSDWFGNPGFEEATAITVTADGKVSGHAALWDTCHTGIQGRCTTPPHSQTDYRFFHLGVVETDSGEAIPVGKITVGTGHAPLTASRAQAASHYDHSGWVGADVVAGEDEHGIWVSGAVRPDITAEQARALRAAALSGDWRRINGNLELVGMLAVNVPGFPVPRAEAITAAGEQEEVLALVAAGIPGEQPPDEETIIASLEGLAGRVDSARGRPQVTETERHMAATTAAR
jgi:2'-5' RNA ligase